MAFLVSELIKKKRNGGTHSREEIRYLISEYSKGNVPDYQMSSWAMSVYFRDMNGEEAFYLTDAMLHSGVVLDFSKIPLPKIDKHSTGGVGDKTSLILGPIAAASGVCVPMVSGRGLGHTGGTLDKLEAIPGFSTGVSLKRFEELLISSRICFAGQTDEICPADKKLYALRDVTGTVESMPLICASIMSKKLAEGINGLVLDVKFGSGAFMKTQADAQSLAEKLADIGARAGKNVIAFLTTMEQPLGRMVGNALEVKECVEILKGQKDPSYADTRELSLQLAGAMIWLGGIVDSLEQGYQIAEKTLAGGHAYEKFAEICRLQGGDLEKLPSAKRKHEILAGRSGYVAGFDTEKIGIAAILLGAGRRVVTDRVDPAVGIEVHQKIGAKIQSQDPMFTLHLNSETIPKDALELLRNAVYFTDSPVERPRLIEKMISRFPS